MGSFKKFEEIIAWQKGRIFCNEIFKIATETPLAKDYKLKDQVTDACGSIMDNIAEGFGRGGNLEFIHHLEISHASACECQSQLYRVLERKYIAEEKFNVLYEKAEEIKRMLLSLINYLLKSGFKGPKYKAKEDKKKK